jgi:hypothetical protein
MMVDPEGHQACIPTTGSSVGGTCLSGGGTVESPPVYEDRLPAIGFPQPPEPGHAALRAAAEPLTRPDDGILLYYQASGYLDRRVETVASPPSAQLGLLELSVEQRHVTTYAGVFGQLLKKDLTELVAGRNSVQATATMTDAQLSGLDV